MYYHYNKYYLYILKKMDKPQSLEKRDEQTKETMQPTRGKDRTD